jgi:hypothetical protein
VELWLNTARLTNTDYGVYRAARAFSFFMASLYMLIFVLLVIGRRFYYSHLGGCRDCCCCCCLAHAWMMRA